MGWSITIKHWHGVAEWTWNKGDDDVCGICRTAYDGCAPDVKYPGDDSPVVWGACGHAFHLQCIQKWLASSNEREQRCPMCRRQWSYKRSGEDAASAGGSQSDQEGEESADLNEDQEQQPERGGPGQQPQREQRQGQAHQRAGQGAAGGVDGAGESEEDEGRRSEDRQFEADGMDLARSGARSSDDEDVEGGSQPYDLRRLPDFVGSGGFSSGSSDGGLAGTRAGAGGRSAAMRAAVAIAEAMALASDHHHHLAGASDSPHGHMEGFQLGRANSYTTQRDRDREARLARGPPGWGAEEGGGARGRGRGGASREAGSAAGALSFSSGAAGGRRGASMRRRHGEDGAEMAIRRFDLGSECGEDEQEDGQTGSGVDMAVEEADEEEAAWL